MPLDPCCDFADWEITDDKIWFPFSKGSTTWNRSTDWLSFRGDKYILVRDKMVSHGEVAHHDSTTTHAYMNELVPDGCIVRGWLLSDGFLISPSSYPFLAMFPHGELHPQESYECVIGVPVNRVCVTAEGDFFVVYRSDTSTSIVYSAGMVRIGSFEIGLPPSAIAVCDEGTNVAVTLTHQYTGLSVTARLFIPEL